MIYDAIRKQNKKFITTIKETKCNKLRAQQREQNCKQQTEKLENVWHQHSTYSSNNEINFRGKYMY